MLVAHLDADCFYVSAERVRDAFLREKPVGVLGNQGACVIAKSYEMKQVGREDGRADLGRREEVPGRHLHQAGLPLVRGHQPGNVDRGSGAIAVRRILLDRRVLPVGGSRGPRTLRPSYPAARFCTASACRSPSASPGRRRLAKLVSDTAKPFGALALIGEQAERALLASRPASDITGIGNRRATTLANYGIVTCLDFASAQPSLIRRLLTVVGEKLCYELRGEKTMPIQTQRPPHKMVSRGGSIGKPSPDPAVQWAWLVRNLGTIDRSARLPRADGRAS